MISTTQGTHATSSDTGFDHSDDASGEAFSHETEVSPAHRTTSVEDGVSVEMHVELAHEVSCFRETLAYI